MSYHCDDGSYIAVSYITPIPYSPISILNKPSTMYNGSYCMTSKDYQYINSSLLIDDLRWSSSNPNIAEIEGTGDTACITTSGGNGTVWITLYDTHNIVYDSFMLHVFNPAMYENDSDILSLCDGRGYRLDVELMAQSRDNTCGYACGAMIINYLLKRQNHINGTSHNYITDLYFASNVCEVDIDVDEPNLYNIAISANGYLAGRKVYGSYISRYSPVLDEQIDVFKNSILWDFPLTVHIAVSAGEAPFYYQINSSGHLVIVTGMYTDDEGN